MLIPKAIDHQSVGTPPATPGHAWPALVLTVVALLFLAVTPPVQSAEPQGLVAFAQDDLGNDWRRAQVEAVREALSHYPGIDFRVSDARGSVALQIKHIEDWAAEGVDVLITSPADSVVMAEVIRRVYEAGTPVVLLSRGVEGDAYTSFVHPDNARIAGQAAGAVITGIRDNGRVLMLEGVQGATTTILRRRAFLEIVSRHPDIHVERRRANFLRADAIRAVEGIIESANGFPFDAIYAQSDSMAAGARMALDAADIPVEALVIVGIDYIAEAREAIIEGRQDVSFTYPTGGREGAELAVALIRGRPVPHEIVLETQRVTVDNVHRVEPIF
ncbi:substrate-binding domain-containing protein [Arhodomonas sp. SL1]|uniref:substrate-binding domain-containing protein n=1 Tax=Arhodomonas sp. SL1 TaxID=3425691 RepID=UPI003F883C55